MNTFLSELTHFRSRWKKDLLRSIAIESAGWFAVMAAALCWLDLFLAFEPLARVVLAGVCLAAMTIWLGIRVAGVIRISERTSAIYADTLLKSRRRVVLTAWEIGSSQSSGSSLTAYLARQGVETAREQLQTLRNERLFPLPGTVLKRVLICFAIAFTPCLFNPGAAFLLVSRYLAPYADIPPYSGFEFTITPDHAEVIYGEDLEINVSVSGKRIREPVRFATRKNGHVLESECFQAGPDTYVQRLERIMQPMEFCFLVGKARSTWHRIDVKYQPHFISGQVTLTPPSYSGRKKKSFSLGAESLTGLKGSSVEMVVKSNRPLKKGELTISPKTGGAHEQTIAGKITAKDEITFQWDIVDHARLSIMINDIQGTPAKEPMKITQTLAPDEKPVVSLLEPMPFSLATPEIKIPVAASIEDDLGVKTCDFHRMLKGYRSRAVPVDIVPGNNDHEIKSELDLASLGVEPGQVLELFIEASDTNPDLTGTGASDIARIKIISAEEYAELVRARTTIADFESRFQKVSSLHYKLIGLLEKTAEQLEQGNLRGEDAREQMKEVREEIRQAVKEINKLADDFAAFDLEKRLSESAARMAEDLGSTLAHKGWDGPDNEGYQAVIEETLRRIKRLETGNAQLERDGEEVGAVSRVLAMGAWYKALIDRQLILVSGLHRYAAGERKSSIPRVLADSESSIRNDLVHLLEELETSVKKLPSGYEELQASAMEFVEKVRAQDIPGPMLASEKAVLNEQPREAWRYALNALEKMQDVLQQCQNNQFAKTCSGTIGFKVPQRLSQTMSQMLESLMNQYSQGMGWGSGTGAAGVGLAGAWEGSYLNGYSAFNMSVYGPERSNPLSSASTGDDGKQDRNGTGSGIGRKVQYSEKIEETEKNQTGGESYFREALPPRYRDAVKSFYNEEKQ